VWLISCERGLRIAEIRVRSLVIFGYAEVKLDADYAVKYFRVRKSDARCRMLRVADNKEAARVILAGVRRTDLGVGGEIWTVQCVVS
jgi:hypothetical protein